MLKKKLGNYFKCSPLYLCFDAKEDGKGMYLLVSVVVSIGIHSDERLFEVHVVSGVLPSFLCRVQDLADQLVGLYDHSFS